MLKRLADVLLLRRQRAEWAGSGFRKAFQSEVAEELLQMLLNLMSIVFFFDKDFRRNIENFNARYLFKSRDNRITVAAIFKDNKLTVKEEDIGDTNVTLIFRDQTALRGFLFSPKPDILGSMLRQDITFNGNLNYLYKFAYMANALKLKFIK